MLGNVPQRELTSRNVSTIVLCQTRIATQKLKVGLCKVVLGVGRLASLSR